MPQEKEFEANRVDPSENPGDDVVDPSEDGSPANVSSTQQADENIVDPGGEGDGPNKWG